MMAISLFCYIIYTIALYPKDCTLIIIFIVCGMNMGSYIQILFNKSIIICLPIVGNDDTTHSLVGDTLVL